MKVKYYRDKMGYTQLEMSQMFGISHQAYSQKEREKAKFNYDEMRAFKLLVNRNVDTKATIDDIFFSE